MNIEQILDQIYVIPEPSKIRLTALIEEVEFPKNHLLFRAGKVETKMFFLKKGIARAYALQNDDEVTFWFGREGEAVISMKSYVENKAGYETIELLEKSQLYQLKVSDLRQLYQADVHIANWGRRFAERELIKTEERIISRQFKTALERYKDMLANNPDLLQRIQLGHIASYLGITQVTLSRIRAEVK